ncbi:uncharacterized protein DS421_2g50080 [Arachis hypogaea]|nr:uncharacterized protein DS421_2g50080 [Arachis hypogaea]
MLDLGESVIFVTWDQRLRVANMRRLDEEENGTNYGLILFLICGIFIGLCFCDVRHILRYFCVFGTAICISSLSSEPLILAPRFGIGFLLVNDKQNLTSVLI